MFIRLYTQKMTLMILWLFPALTKGQILSSIQWNISTLTDTDSLVQTFMVPQWWIPGLYFCSSSIIRPITCNFTHNYVRLMGVLLLVPSFYKLWLKALGVFHLYIAKALSSRHPHSTPSTGSGICRLYILDFTDDVRYKYVRSFISLSPPSRPD